MSLTDRLREHPEDRLASPVQFADLAAAAAQLRTEAHASVAGHRQIALLRHGPVTLLLFLFDANGILKEHRTEGVVTIQAVSGHLVVTTEGAAHNLVAGQLISLAPGIAHTVRSLAPSEMLLTIHQTHSDPAGGPA
jgi:quercetin dioxygenase-like cupin family protein